MRLLLTAPLALIHNLLVDFSNLFAGLSKDTEWLINYLEQI